MISLSRGLPPLISSYSAYQINVNQINTRYIVLLPIVALQCNITKCHASQKSFQVAFLLTGNDKFLLVLVTFIVHPDMKVC